MNTVEELALDIITDPKIPWQKITGEEGLLFERTKYIADGIREKRHLRVVFEPNAAYSCGRGILAILDLEKPTADRVTGYAEKIVDLLNSLKRYLEQNDISLIQYYLYRNEPILAFEILCDILTDERTELCEIDAQKIKNLSDEMSLDSHWTWDFLVCTNSKTGKTTYAFRDEKGLKEDKIFLSGILENIKMNLNFAEIDSINSFIQVGEYELAVEYIEGALLEKQIPISRLLYKKFESLAKDYCNRYLEEKKFRIL